MSQENDKAASIRKYQEYYEQEFLSREAPLKSALTREVRYRLDAFREEIGLSMRDAAAAEEFVRQQYRDRLSEFENFVKEKVYGNYPLTSDLIEEIKGEGLTRLRLVNSDVQEIFEEFQEKQENDIQALKLNLSSELSKYYLDSQDYGLPSSLFDSIYKKSDFSEKVTEQILGQIREPIWNYCQQVKEFLLNDPQDNSTLNPESVRELLERIRDRYQIDQESVSYAISHILEVICKEPESGKLALPFSSAHSPSFRIQRLPIIVLLSIILFTGISLFLFRMLLAYQKSQLAIEHTPFEQGLPGDDIASVRFYTANDCYWYWTALHTYKESGDFEKAKSIAEKIGSNSRIYQEVQQSLKHWEEEYEKNQAALNAIQEDINQERLGDAENKLSNLELTILGQSFDENIPSGFWQEKIENLSNGIEDLKRKRAQSSATPAPKPAASTPRTIPTPRPAPAPSPAPRPTQPPKPSWREDPQ